MNSKSMLKFAVVTGLVVSPFLACAQATAPADGITMDMMPITQEQLTACRSQATGQLTDEQKTLHGREHGQDKDKMAQGAISGAAGAASTALTRARGGWWGYGNNNGAGVAGATGATQRTDRNSQDVASTTDVGQKVGVDAYQQCVNGIKGPEYIHFRQTGQMTGGNAAVATHAPDAAAMTTPVSTPAPLPTKSPVQDEGDGKHFILTAPGQTDAREVILIQGTKNRYVEETTGDKYVVMPDGGVTRIAGVKKTGR